MTTHRQALERMDSFLESKGIGYNAKEAQAYALLSTADGLDVHLLQSDKDIYDLLDTTVVADALRTTDFVALVTCGWATKMTDDNTKRPSEQPDRVRVRLVVVTDKQAKQASVMRIESEPEAMFDEDGQASGSLADAVRKAAKRKSFDEAVRELIDEIAKGE